MWDLCGVFGNWGFCEGLYTSKIMYKVSIILDFGTPNGIPRVSRNFQGFLETHSDLPKFSRFLGNPGVPLAIPLTSKVSRGFQGFPRDFRGLKEILGVRRLKKKKGILGDSWSLPRIP